MYPEVHASRGLIWGQLKASLPCREPRCEGATSVCAEHRLTRNKNRLPDVSIPNSMSEIVYEPLKAEKEYSLVSNKDGKNTKNSYTCSVVSVSRCLSVQQPYICTVRCKLIVSRVEYALLGSYSCTRSIVL